MHASPRTSWPPAHWATPTRTVDTCCSARSPTSSTRATQPGLLALELHDRWQRVLGPDHPDTLTAAAYLTAALIYLGKHEQAHVVGEDALRRARPVLGPDHSDTLRLLGSKITLGVLGPLAPALGPESPDTEHVDALAEDTMQGLLRTLGPDHPITLLLSLNMGRVMALALKGDAATARAECEDAFRRARNSLGPDHTITLGLAATLTFILVLQGSTEQARTLGEDTVTRSRRRLGIDHFLTLLGGDRNTFERGHLACNPVHVLPRVVFGQRSGR